jgi:osmotically-inducible protein OsmY/predicted Ser/Thr protein kinase
MNQTPNQNGSDAGNGGGSGGGSGGREGTSLNPGSLLAHTYEIVGMLARGGMGEVYRARHRYMGTEHAIKVILPELASDQRVVGLFRREAQVLRQLRHEAVVAYDGLFSDEYGRVYLAMEFVDGPSLKDALKNGAIPPDEVRMLRDRLASGLAAAHEAGVVHRDLSPDNVILPEGRLDQAKIIDFGIAKRTDPEKSTIIGSQFAGKYSYASPEQFGMYGGDVGPKSDVYSLGLILAAAASGTALPMGTSTIEVVEARRKVPDLAGVPDDLRGEIAPLLEPDPKDRPDSMREIVGLGRPGARGRPEGRATPPARRTAARRGGGARMAALSLLALLAAGAAGGAYWYWQQSQGGGGGVLARLEQAAAGQACSEVAGTLDDDGTLALSGRVGSEADRDALLDRLSGLEGVSAVSGELSVVPCGGVDRQAIRIALAGAFGAFACADLTAAVEEDGTVRLGGTIGSGQDLALLRRQVRDIDGVAAVEDRVAVEPCPTDDRPDDLRAAVGGALGAFTGDGCADLSFELADGGRVRLFGEVASRADRDALHDAVAGIDGVAAVDNAVAVVACEEPEPPPDRRTVAAAVDRAVDAVACGDVNAVVTDDFRVHLSGTIGGAGQAQALSASVAAIGGVADVTSTLTFEPCLPDDFRPEDLAAEIAEIAGTVQCARVDTEVTDDLRVRLSGYVNSMRDRRRLETRMQEVEHVTAVEGDLSIVPWPLCEAIAMAGPGGGGSGGEGIIGIAANNPDGVYAQGERLVLEITAPDFDGFLYVDYFDSNQNVVHMLPSPARSDNRVGAGDAVTIGQGEGPTYRIPAASGANMILVVAAPRKLFATPRPELEDARQYLPDLQGAIERLNEGDGPDAAVGYLILTLTPA